MLTRVKLALAGSAMLACALPASAQAQSYYYDSYGYAPSYGYAEPYAWGPSPYGPVNAAAGFFGAATEVVASPFIGWRDGAYVDQRIDPVGYPYDGYTTGYRVTNDYGYAPAYGDVTVERYGYAQPQGWNGWDRGYVATYRGKAHKAPKAARLSAKRHVLHVSSKAPHKGQATHRGHLAQR